MTRLIRPWGRHRRAAVIVDGLASIQLNGLINRDPYINFGATTTNLAPGPITYAFLFSTPIVDTYRAVELPDPVRARVQEQWDALKVDYALRYLDSMIQGIREGAERTRKIVRDLRVFARSEDEVWQPVDLHEEIESSLTLLNHLLKDRVTVHRKLGALPSVECVRSQIDQVFLNLLANAAQAIEGPGDITVETRVDDGCAVVVIGDTGPGIPPEIMGRVFDPFFTTKPVGEGTGLGLSISYGIVERHRGRMTVANHPDGGAVFTLTLPLAD